MLHFVLFLYYICCYIYIYMIIFIYPSYILKSHACYECVWVLIILSTPFLDKKERLKDIRVRHFKLSFGDLYCPNMNVWHTWKIRVRWFPKWTRRKIVGCCVLAWLREKQINLLSIMFPMSPGSHILACYSCRTSLHCYWWNLCAKFRSICRFVGTSTERNCVESEGRLVAPLDLKITI